MQVIVLGTDKNDKGKQLEKLTSKILSYLGYKNIVVNYRGSGGEEIDVKAKISFSTLSGESSMPVVAECKAHNRPVEMTDWLKFLGKLLVEEALSKSNVFGCFIALSGVNGNVAGNFETLRKNKNYIEIYDGEKLADVLSQVFGLAEVDDVLLSVSRIPTRRTVDLVLAYYKNEVYWVITFSDNSYTILTDEGVFAKRQDVEHLLSLIESSTSAHTYVNLQEEEEARNLSLKLQKEIITFLMQSNRQQTKDDVEKILKDYSKQEIEEALKTLTEKNWIIENKNSNYLSLPSNNKKNFYKIFIELLKFIFTGEFNPKLLESPYYDSNINNRFLEEILKIQGNLPLSKKEKQRALTLLKMSPSAVASYLHPNYMFKHRLENKQVDSRTEIFDKNHFFRNIYNSLRADFENPALFSYLFETKGLRELETKAEFRIKLEDDTIIESYPTTRLAIARLDESLGGKHGSVMLMEDVPDKWWKMKLEEVNEQLEK